MRITGGSLGGRKLVAPAGNKTRPTSDKVKQAIFNMLGPPPENAQVLDFFAGSGSLGLEAISRGAGFAHFFEVAGAALQSLSANISAMGLQEQCKVYRGDSLTLMRHLAVTSPLTWVFLDPPYASDLGERALAILGEATCLDEHSTIVYEHSSRKTPKVSPNLTNTKTKVYGDTAISFYRRAAPHPTEKSVS